MLKDALYGVNDQIQQAEQAAAMLVKGEIEYHDAIIITEKANLALQLTLAIHNKIQEAYQKSCVFSLRLVGEMKNEDGTYYKIIQRIMG